MSRIKKITAKDRKMLKEDPLLWVACNVGKEIMLPKKRYFLIEYFEDDDNKSVSVGVQGNLIIRNKNKNSRNIYFDNAIELTEDELDAMLCTDEICELRKYDIRRAIE